MMAIVVVVLAIIRSMIRNRRIGPEQNATVLALLPSIAAGIEDTSRVEGKNHNPH